MREHARLDDGGGSCSRTPTSDGRLSARGHERILKVARTIADLAGRDQVHAEHVNARSRCAPSSSEPTEVAA